MKRFLPLLSLALILSLSLSACNNSAPETNPDTPSPVSSETSDTKDMSNLKRYGVKSGMVKFTLTGVQSGTKTLYWDDWGMKETEIKDLKTEYAGVSIEQKEVTVLDGDIIYSYDPEKKTGTKIRNTLLATLAENNKNDDLGEIGLEMLKATGAEKTGNKEVAGKTCDIYETKALGTTSCVWEAVTLEVITTFAGMETEVTATEVDTDSPVDASLFELPEDIEWQDMGSV